MNSISINTSQNVNLQFPMVSLGDRMLAFVIDSIIKAAYLIILFFVITKIFDAGGIFDSWDNWSLMAFVTIITLPVSLYTLVFESMMEGQTPGKKMMKCKVVKIDGYQASFIDYLTRWVFRIIDVLISSGVFGLIFIITTKYGQRLGGLASGTTVISLKQKDYLSQTLITEIEEDYQPSFPQVRALSDADMRIIIRNFQQANSERRYEVIHKLADKIRETTGIPDQRSEMNDKDFIIKVIEDFNHYTGQEV
ncbi:RDD family protein [Flavobacteriaceae bacterium Ap0902]|nr:RDD family protein [Flavobacteriaceae bacterium Ap0902]